MMRQQVIGHVAHFMATCPIGVATCPMGGAGCHFNNLLQIIHRYVHFLCLLAKQAGQMIGNKHTCGHVEILSFCSIRPPKQIENVKRVTTYPAFPYSYSVL